MFETVRGEIDQEGRQEIELHFLRSGRAQKTIFLNGGSDTRAGMRDYYAEFARQHNIRFESKGGCVIVLGGR